MTEDRGASAPDREPVYFWVGSEEYSALSNSSRFGFTMDGKEWPTVEHYLQASKFQDPAKQEEIRQTGAAYEAAAKGYGPNTPPSATWYPEYHSRMRRAVEAKVKEHPTVRRVLRSTAGRQLIHVSDRPRYNAPNEEVTWRIVEENALGKILMEIRGSVLQQPPDPLGVVDEPSLASKTPESPRAAQVRRSSLRQLTDLVRNFPSIVTEAVRLFRRH